MALLKLCELTIITFQLENIVKEINFKKKK